MNSRFRRPAIRLAALWLALTPVSNPGAALAVPPAYEIVEITPGNEVKGAPPVEGKPSPTMTNPAGLRYARLGQGYAGEIEPNGTSATASPIVGTNAVVRASLYPNGDVDFYSFTAAAGDRVYAAVMTSGSPGNSTDSQLTLLSSDGTTVLEFDDDNGSFAALSSSIAGTTIPAAGTYSPRLGRACGASRSRALVVGRCWSRTPAATPSSCSSRADSADSPRRGAMGGIPNVNGRHPLALPRSGMPPAPHQWPSLCAARDSDGCQAVTPATAPSVTAPSTAGFSSVSPPRRCRTRSRVRSTMS